MTIMADMKATVYLIIATALSVYIWVSVVKDHRDEITSM